MSKSKIKDFTEEIENKELEEGLENQEIQEEEIKIIEEPKVKVKSTKKGQQFKVFSIVSEKAVMAKGLEDDKWYSKPNNNYRIGEIID